MYLCTAFLTCCVLPLQLVFGASYNNCRLLSIDKQLYHRRIQKDPVWHRQFTVVSYPERLIDRSQRPKVITCIRCQDLVKSESEDCECKIIAGGVGHTHATISIACKPHKGTDYDIKIFGH